MNFYLAFPSSVEEGIGVVLKSGNCVARIEPPLACAGRLIQGGEFEK
jgi:hypothetical protein